MNTEIKKLKEQLGQLSAEERKTVIETSRSCIAALEPNDDYIKFIHEVFAYPLEETKDELTKSTKQTEAYGN